MRFFRKPVHYIEYKPEYGNNILLDFNGTVVEVAGFSKRPQILYIDGKYQAVDVTSVNDIKGTLELVEDALLLEENDILSEAFELGSMSHHLIVDYHNLTMLGDEFDKKVAKLKKKLGERNT